MRRKLAGLLLLPAIVIIWVAGLIDREMVAAEIVNDDKTENVS